MINKFLKTIGSILLVGTFLFLAFGSDETKSGSASSSSSSNSKKYRTVYSGGYAVEIDLTPPAGSVKGRTCSDCGGLGVVDNQGTDMICPGCNGKGFLWKDGNEITNQTPSESSYSTYNYDDNSNETQSSSNENDSINSTDDENDMSSNIKSADDNVKDNLNIEIGKYYKGGTIIYLDGTKEHGIICSKAIITDRVNSLEISKQKSVDYFDNGGNWRLPSKSDFKLIANLKNIIDLKDETFWTSNEDSKFGLVYESTGNSFVISSKQWQSSALIYVKNF